MSQFTKNHCDVTTVGEVFGTKVLQNGFEKLFNSFSEKGCKRPNNHIHISWPKIGIVAIFRREKLCEKKSGNIQ